MFRTGPVGVVDQVDKVLHVGTLPQFGAVDKVIPTHKKYGTIAAGQLSYHPGKADAPAPRPTGNYPVARSWYNRENGKG